MTESDAESPSEGQGLIAAGTALIFAACFVIYWPALRGDFLWDDVLNILTNPVVHSDRGLITIWTGGSRDVYDYYPMTWTTWWLEWRAWRKDTLGYHVLNVLLHAGAASFLWRVFVRLKITGAFVAALLFAVHPVNVETVAWISERKNTLSVFLLAIALLLYLDSVRDEETPRRRRGLYWASVVGFALTLLAKPSVVMLPVCLLAIAWWRDGRVTRRDVFRVVPFFVIAGAISLVTVLVHHGRAISTSEIRTDGFASRLVGAGRAVWFYLYKLVWPAELSFIYPRWELDPRSATQWLPLAGLAVLAVLLYALRNRIGRGLLAAFVCYVALLLPVLGFVNVYFMRYSFVSDHWQYPAAIVGIAAVVGATTAVLRRVPIRVAGPALAVLVSMALGWHAWREAHVYRSNAALWADVLAHHPNSALANNNYGAELWAMGRRDEARAHYLRSIELDPRAWEGYVSMGVSHLYTGQLREAIAWFRKAVTLHGSGKHPRIRLADALLAGDRFDEALEQYEQALAADPDAPLDRAIVGALMESKGRTDAALELYRQQAKMFPRDPEGWFRLSSALLRFGRADEGRTAFAEARRVAGKDHALLTSFGSRMILSGQPALAVDALHDAIRIKPDHGPAHNHLGRALEALGRPDEAAAAYSQAVRVQPTFYEAKSNLWRLTSSTQPATTPAAQ